MQYEVLILSVTSFLDNYYSWNTHFNTLKYSSCNLVKYIKCVVKKVNALLMMSSSQTAQATAVPSSTEVPLKI